MPNETKKIKFLISRGSPITGEIIRAGSELDFPVFWADKFIEDGTAVEVEKTKTPVPSKSRKK